MRNARGTEKRVNDIINEILEENEETNFNATRSEACPGGCEESDSTAKEVSCMREKQSFIHMQ